MGLLLDIRSGKRDPFGVGGRSIVFWLAAGASIGAIVSGVDPQFAARATALVTAGGVLGLGIGFYAACGQSKIATALSVPGAILCLVFGL